MKQRYFFWSTYTDKLLDKPPNGAKDLRRLFVSYDIDCWPVKWGNLWDLKFGNKLVGTGERTLYWWTRRDWLNFAVKHRP